MSVKKSTTNAKPAKSADSKAASANRKKTLHPNFREIKVVMTNGTDFVTRSTYHNDVMKLDVDVTTHPAWTNESNFVNVKADKVAAFSSKYQGLNFIKKQ